MKKLLCLVLCLAMITCVFAACAKEEPAPAPAAPAAPAADSTPNQDAAPAEQAPAEPAPAPAAAKPGDVNGDGKVVLGYISKNLTDVFHIDINNHAKETFEQWVKDGIIDEFTGVLDGQTDPNIQINLAQDCISKGCDYVVFLPAERDASDPALTQMVDAGIKVLCVNSETTSTADKAVALTISDDHEAGTMMANYIVEKCPNGGKYIHCQGAQGNSAQIARGEGMHEVMDANDKFELVGEAYNVEWSADSAVNQATDALTKYGDELVAVICDNDDMSSAVQRYMNSNGRSDVFCIGVDGNQGPIQMIKDGELGATIKQDGVGQLQRAMDIIQADIKGESWTNDPIPFVLVDASNCDQYLK